MVWLFRSLKRENNPHKQILNTTDLFVSKILFLTELSVFTVEYLFVKNNMILLNENMSFRI